MLKGKTAVITGSTSGIGLGYAKAFAKQGVNIVINGFGDADKIEQERASLEKDFGIEAQYSNADMTKPSEIEAMIKNAEQHFGAIDILINNAGIQHVAPIEDFPVEKWDFMIALLLTSAFHTMRCVIPGMKKRKFGRIINTSSAHGLVASPFKSAYVTAKHGILGLTKTAALETARDGITVNAICPGYVLTPLVESQIPDTMAVRHMTKEQVVNDILLASQPTKEFVTIEQVADMAVFLAQESSSSITGAHFSIDGGWTAA
ncbi:3-hydroxybutyrate dehydrogenase [Bartonella sp. HY329]|uniref:3-hydroxybutyrate dehydrogenase n=1 Tax=unclassified Bartonella TaxID=2645622 RepID=UPI0021C5EA90|nr:MULTISPECIES: 3-hydroxybutyrate dehydrogenase [unclassified Bartonella]UXM94747.1 3-hydroxybutyrate dehydrogenase [Bartonella sp. HY329]UXN09070.1 3-hydroxybutyrate dehydrogenase [Bartonella sp. HY328]